jgi:DNA (cytosine-5)-methyltransferase 1
MKFGSLFSGIGGIDLGLERAGMTCAWQVENDPWCQRVLAKHWPDVARFGDVRGVGLDDLEWVEVIAGGFPCQPVSDAGNKKAQADERWLWPEFARIVGALRPNYVVVENAPGLLARGFGDVLGDLAAVGYDCEWDCVPAALFGAPHLRYRVILVAHAQGFGGPLRASSGQLSGRPSGGGDAADSNGYQHEGGAPKNGGAPTAVLSADSNEQRGQLPAEWRQPAEQEPWGDSAPGSPEAGPGQWWATEPDVGRVANGVPHRVDRLRGLGNAVVPQVAEWIGHQLMAHLGQKTVSPPSSGEEK